jgi:poly(A) polymerase
VTFTRHEQLGAYLFGGIAARFGFPQDRAERISFILSYHGRVNAYETDWTDRAIRRLVRDLGPHLDDILAFAGADYTTKRRRKQAHIRERLQQLVVRIQQQRSDGVTTSKVPAGLGQAIIGDLNVERGPAVGAWIAWIEDQVQKGELDEVPTLSTCLKAIRRAQHEGLTP